MSAARAPLPVRLVEGRLYYGWVLVGALAVTETTSYGILSYAFPVFLAPMGAELGWSRTAMTGAFSLAMLVGGVAAIPVGRWVDRHGARGLMTGGSVATTLLLLAWAAVDSLWAFYLTWIGLGAASAAVLYEPAFAVLARWFVRLRSRALTLLTFGGGFASVIFAPLAAWLVAGQGWRAALVWLAVIYGTLTILPHALLLRRAPEDVGLAPDGDAGAPALPATAFSGPKEPARQAVRSRTFMLLAAAFGLSSLVTTAAAVHLIPLLLERGFDAGFAAAAVGAVGLMAMPGRLVFTPLGGRWSRTVVTSSIFVLQAFGIAALLGLGGVAGVWTFIVLFGAGFGAITPARAALVAEVFGAARFGAISGFLALVLAVARAAAPVGASVLHTLGGGYDAVLWAALVLAAASTMAVWLAGSEASRHESALLEIRT